MDVGRQLPEAPPVSNHRHGMSGTKVHNTWLRMFDRCRNDRSGNYGRRGICVCERWESFELFYLDMEEPPTQSHSIDRLDVNGDYEPSNCRWATRTEQARNTRRNTILAFAGKSQTIAEWSEETGIKATTLCRRLYDYGWSLKRALTEPVAQPLPLREPWKILEMSRSSWYRAGRPMP